MPDSIANVPKERLRKAAETQEPNKGTAIFEHNVDLYEE
jgi:hypothetical protein